MLFRLVEGLRGRLMPFPFWIRNTGKRGEYLARRQLHRRGFHLLAHNYRKGRTEIDLIMADGRELLFVEVKTRQEQNLREDDVLVRKQQQQRIRQSGYAYLNNWGEMEIPHRFITLLVAYQPGWKSWRLHEQPLFS